MKKITAALLLSCGFLPVWAGDACLSSEHLLFVNGIQNTRNDLKESRQKIDDVLSASQRVTDRRRFVVEAIYNPIGFYGSTVGSDAINDVKELFIQKVAEERFAADFQRIIYGHTNASGRAPDKAAAVRVAAYIDKFLPGNNYIETNGKAVEADFAGGHHVHNGVLGCFHGL